jgi:hypothetical protein
MKMILASLALASVSALGLASKADAAPMAPITASTAFHGRGHGGWGVGFGVGVSSGGGYGYAPSYAQPSGYYATQYRWVPTTVFAGYDQWNRPVYTTQYVQQAYQVWVPTASYYAPSYASPRVSFGFGVGYRWR